MESAYLHWKQAGRPAYWEVSRKANKNTSFVLLFQRAPLDLDEAHVVDSGPAALVHLAGLGDEEEVDRFRRQQGRVEGVRAVLGFFWMASLSTNWEAEIRCIKQIVNI